MTETNITTPATTKGISKEKKLRKIIEEKLSITLLEYKSILGTKKFETRIKKAGKLFAGDIIRLTADSKPKKKKDTRKK